MENSQEFSDLEVGTNQNSNGSVEGVSNGIEMDFENIEQRALKRGEKAKLLVEKSLEIKSRVESELDSVEDEVLEDIEDLEAKREEFFNGSFREGKIILEKFNFEYSTNNENIDMNLSLDRRVDDLHVKDISTGAFSGFLMALISMVGVFGASIYFIASKLGLDLKLKDFPNINMDISVYEKIFAFVSKLIVGEENPDYGVVIIGIVALLVGFTIYKIRVILKESKNYREANRIYEETNIYIQNLKEQIEDFRKIGKHIREIIPTIIDYEYLLNEDIAKLKRALHVEGQKGEFKDYHSSTIETLKGAKRLMRQSEELLTTPIIENGALSNNAILVLNDTKNVYNYFISQIYN